MAKYAKHITFATRKYHCAKGTISLNMQEFKTKQYNLVQESKLFTCSKIKSVLVRERIFYIILYFLYILVILSALSAIIRVSVAGFRASILSP